jgi:ATP-dependent Clp protease ATP-binding subunit ClpA
MLERFAAESVQALHLAKASALGAGSKFIDSQHVLAGALGVASHLALSAESILLGLRLEMPTHTSGVNSPHIQFSPAVQRLLQEAMAVADRLGHHRIRPEHLLLALLEGPACAAREALRGGGCETQTLSESATRAALADDGPLTYTAHLESRIVPGSTNLIWNDPLSST